MDSKPGQHHQWNRVAWHALDDALGRIGVPDFADDERVKSDYGLSAEADIGERRPGL